MYLQCTNLSLQTKHQCTCNVQTYHCRPNINAPAMYKLITSAETSMYLQYTNLSLHPKHQHTCNVQTYHCNLNINIPAMYKLIIAAKTSTYLQCTNLSLQPNTSIYLQCTNLSLHPKHQRTCNVQTYHCSHYINVPAMYKLITAP